MASTHMSKKCTMCTVIKNSENRKMIIQVQVFPDNLTQAYTHITLLQNMLGCASSTSPFTSVKKRSFSFTDHTEQFHIY